MYWDKIERHIEADLHWKSLQWDSMAIISTSHDPNTGKVTIDYTWSNDGTDEYGQEVLEMDASEFSLKFVMEDL